MADQERKYTYKLIDPDSVEIVKATEYLVEGLVVLGEITFVWGAPKHFKTMFVMAALLCVALGIPFFGRKVLQRKVLYMVGEGADAFQGRIKAWQRLNKIEKLKGRFFVVPRTVNLFSWIDVKKAIGEAEAQGFKPEPGDVLVIDPLGRAMGKAQENTTDFNIIFEHLDKIRQEVWLGITEVVISHPKKGEDVYRGPGVIAADSDNFVFVKRDGKQLRAQVSCEFARNAAEFESFGFTLGLEKVMTTKGWQDFPVVNALIEGPGAVEAEKNDKQRRERELDDLAHKILVGLYTGPENWTEWSFWFEAVKARRGEQGLGRTSFSQAVKRLVDKDKVLKRRMGKNMFYQAVFGAGGEDAPVGPDVGPEPGKDGETISPGTPISPDTSPEVLPYKGGGLQDLRTGPGISPGTSGLDSSKSGNGHSQESPVVRVRDKAQIALERLLNKKPPAGV